MDEDDEWGLLNLGQVITTDCCRTLHKASRRGHPDCIRSFIEQGANIEERDDAYHNNMTPLLTAVANGHAECARILIENGNGSEGPDGAETNINALDKNGETPLHLACEYGYFWCLDVLLKARANINIKDMDGYSAFHKASRNGHIDCMQALIECGVDVNESVLRRENPRPYGCPKGRGESALHLAVYSHVVECVKLLITHGANVNAQDNHGRTPLHYAVYSEAIGIAEVLLSAGANPLLGDHKNRTPKDVAIRHNDKYWQAYPETTDLSERFQNLINSYEEEPIKIPDHD